MIHIKVASLNTVATLVVNMPKNFVAVTTLLTNMPDVNPIQTGGRGFYPHGLWTFITFLISKLKPSNLVTFPKIYLETIWYSTSLSIKFDVTMATTF